MATLLMAILSPEINYLNERIIPIKSAIKSAISFCYFENSIKKNI